jgi:hypothetical protein
MPNKKELIIHFADDNLKIKLYSNPLSEFIYSRYRHLKNLSLSFNDRDIFFKEKNTNIDLAKIALREYANWVSVTVDISKLSEQDYLNYLHEIYEKNFDGTENWLKFHEQIHTLEILNSGQNVQPIISFDYRTLGGPLEGSFKREYYNYSTLSATKNQCFLRWQELAKPPYNYWKDKEPDDINRFCQLSKPWVTLKTAIHVACDNINFLENVDLFSFNEWFSQFREQWCTHWGIVDWDQAETFKFIKIGEIEDVDILVDNIKKNNLPLRIST